jgi:hypothetical protein
MANGTAGDGVATCAKQNSYTNDGNGNTEKIECTLK